MPSWRNLQAAEQPVYGRRSLSCRRQHVGLQGLKKKRICHTQPRKPSGIGTRSDREISKNCLQIRRTQFVLASLQPCVLTTLHPYNITLLRFHFSTSPFRPFGLSQSSKQHPQKTKLGLTQKRITVRRAHQENGLRSFFKELNQICAANKKPPCYLFSDKY